MKIKVISDTHGFLPDVGKFDLLLICGDICPVECHWRSFQKEWVNEDFINWVNSLEYNDAESKVVMIPGNHDFVFEGTTNSKLRKLETSTKGRLKILINEEYETHGLRIFGTPYCDIFGNWAFMREPETLEKKFGEIPEEIDILLTHDAPDINELGMIHQGRWSGTNAGNQILAKAIEEKKPKYAFCGHIHSGNHDFFEHNGMKMKNVSYVDERYEESGEIFEFEIKQEEDANQL